jgi:hypothetical protein
LNIASIVSTSTDVFNTLSYQVFVNSSHGCLPNAYATIGSPEALSAAVAASTLSKPDIEFPDAQALPPRFLAALLSPSFAQECFRWNTGDCPASACGIFRMS